MKNLKLISIFLVFTSINIFSQTLKPGDGIRINFYNVPENISGDYYIQDNGKIQLPYLGMIKATKLDFSVLKNEIMDGYSKIYRDPELGIQALYRICILGEVGKPGIYYLNGYETIFDLLSIAGGETNNSNIDEIKIIKNDNQLEIDMNDFINGENNLVDIGIESGDKVYVPRKCSVSIKDASVIVSSVAVLVALASLLR